MRGLLVVIDNLFFFYGQTAGRADSAAQQRHLNRLRIIAGEGLRQLLIIASPGVPSLTAPLASGSSLMRLFESPLVPRRC